MVGLPGAGKTTLLESLHLGAVTASPESTVEVLEHRSLKIISYDITADDVGSEERIQEYDKVDAVIFVVDAMHSKRLDEAIQALKAYIAETRLAKAVFLVYANKTDLLCAANSLENASTLNKALAAIDDALSVRNGRRKVEMSSAKTGRGLEEGLQWVFEALEDL